VAFSPASKLLAAAGDSRIIALYDVNSGEQVANFTGHGGWIMSLDWSDTGEYLLSGYVYEHSKETFFCENTLIGLSTNLTRSHDSKAKVWRIETRSCVATYSQGDKPIWAAKWLPKVGMRSEMFALAGGNQSISFYREAAG
jgi:superkiller protein 8